MKNIIEKIKEKSGLACEFGFDVEVVPIDFIEKFLQEERHVNKVDNDCKFGTSMDGGLLVMHPNGDTTLFSDEILKYLNKLILL